MSKVFCNLESLLLPPLPEQWECLCASQEWLHNLLLLIEKWHGSDYTDKTMNNVETRRGEHSASTTLGECRALLTVLGGRLCCCPWWCSCGQRLMPLWFQLLPVSNSPRKLLQWQFPALYSTKLLPLSYFFISNPYL